MKKITTLILACSVAITTSSVMAATASSEKQANKAVELRQSIYALLGSNMGILGAMAKGDVPVDASVVERNATRINQLSLMMDDYTRLNTSKFNLKTAALDKMWSERSNFEQRITDLTDASATLQKVAASGDVNAIKKAIGAVGKTCGGCHDVFKKD
ncbi:c-type cytochrome [Thalassotalea piscium]|uniref:Cytochrome c556 n=1 Tax=Thalassotalea piscium TaxID=1230533 RepID=A0A7X0NER9_9GAMM|nr:cytochrome c [Thalassotalea piscium]MBB6542107.1 cytochrome c556 [Thalassotalea piscium]